MADKCIIYNLLLKKYAIGGLFIVVGSIVIAFNKSIGIALALIGLFISCIMARQQYKKTHLSFSQNIELVYFLLEENRIFFQNYGPNSSAGNTTYLRTGSQLKLWEAARKNKIIPNNQKMMEIIRKIENQFDNEEKCIIDKMKKHIFAFEVHSKDLSIDYSEHRFPIEFTNLIVQKLNTLQNPYELTERYREWLCNINLEMENKITEAFIFGSSLYLTSPKDIDVVISYKGTPLDFQPKLTAMKKNFKKTFNVPVHITAFSHAEKSEYEKFIRRCGEMIQIEF